MFSKKKEYESQGLNLRDRLYYVALTRMQLNSDTSNECIQETYLKFFEQLNKDTCNIRKVDGWLVKVLFVSVKVFFKKQYEIEDTEVPFCKLSEVEVETCLIDKGTSTPEKIELREQEKEFLHKVSKLDKKEKVLLFDIYFSEKKLSQIADEQGKSVNCIKKRHQRLKEKIMKSYKGDKMAVGGQL